MSTELTKVENEIKELQSQIVDGCAFLIATAIKIGKLLNNQKDNVLKDKFGAWVKDKLPCLSRATAWNYMTLAKNEKEVLVESKTVSGALNLLGPPKKEKEESNAVEKPEVKKTRIPEQAPKSNPKTTPPRTQQEPATPKKLLTSAGQEVPEHLIPVFERVNELKLYVQQCTNIMKPIKKAVADGDPLMNYLNLNSLEVAMADVKRNFKFAIPYAICPYCQADDNPDCRCCKGIGFINQTSWEATPEDMRK